MPDTGAPWNIPYVASTDLVSDWPADSLALANAIDAGLDAAGNAGIGSNVVMGTTTTTTTTASATAVDTACTATITPTSATSKVLVLYSAAQMSSASEDQAIIDLYSPNAAGTLVVADLIRNRIVPTGYTTITPASFVYLDSPATTSAKTYTVTLYRDGSAANVTVQRRQQLILIEVAA